MTRSRPNSKMNLILMVALLITISGEHVFCAPWVNIFSGNDHQRPAYYRQHRQGKSGKDRWKEICRTINPNGYAFPGQVPYPAAPVCPW